MPVPLKYLSSLWRTFEMPLIMLSWSANCIIYGAKKAKPFAITDPKFCVLVLTLSVHDKKNCYNN